MTDYIEVPAATLEEQIEIEDECLAKINQNSKKQYDDFLSLPESLKTSYSELMQDRINKLREKKINMLLPVYIRAFKTIQNIVFNRDRYRVDSPLELSATDMQKYHNEVLMEQKRATKRNLDFFSSGTRSGKPN